MNNDKVQLKIIDLSGSFLVAKLAALSEDDELLSASAYDGEFVSISTTPDENSIVCENTYRNRRQLENVAKLETGWSLLRVLGQLEFEMVGVIARFSSALAEAKIPLFCLSTFDTDYILVKESRRAEALQVLQDAGIEHVQ